MSNHTSTIVTYKRYVILIGQLHATAFQFTRRKRNWMTSLYFAIHHTLYSQFIGISCRREPTRGQTCVELNYPSYGVHVYFIIGLSGHSRSWRTIDTSRADTKKMQITCLIGQRAKTVNYSNGLGVLADSN